MALMV
ncbi:hypothetical protein LINPERPRIM_LOCUS3701 [Linum perenne]|jgi:hypothetical protein